MSSTGNSRSSKKQCTAPQEEPDRTEGSKSAHPQHQKQPQSVHAKKNQIVKLPAQLASLVRGMEQGLVEDGLLENSVASAIYACNEPDESQTSAHLPSDSVRATTANTTAQIVAACQNRFTKELASYTRATCMRLGYA